VAIKLERPRRPVWVRALVVGAVLYGTIIVTMVLFERSMIFFPDRYPIGIWDVEAIARGAGVTIEDRTFTASDGVTLHAWWCRPEAAAGPTAEMVVLWFHGNAGNLAQRADGLLALARLPAQVLIVDYRGYGRSAGRPSEEGLYRDGRAAWRHLTEDAGIDPDRIVLLGVSLGGAVAVDLATEVEPAGLILQSTFTSVPEMAAHHYPFIPRWLVRTKLDSLAKIGRVRCPILVVHSAADEIVPFDHGRRLHAAAGSGARMVVVEGAGHNQTRSVGGRLVEEELRRFLLDCRSGGGGRT
jgi:fermentation-respiration switch protein FrsA (DUF1100 family)